jgi:hypothetical protein
MSQTLQAYIEAEGYDVVEVMNALQDHGVISDNCEHVAEVGNGGIAVWWLEANYTR